LTDKRLEDVLLPDIALVPQDFRDILRALSYDFATTGVCAIAFLSILLRKPVSFYGFDFYRPTQTHAYFNNKPADAFIGHENEYEFYLLDKFFGNLVSSDGPLMNGILECGKPVRALA
jgi:hypothetical protein